jgi:nicotinamidase-related amidase
LLTSENTVLTIIDVQGKLAQIMYDKNSLFANLQRIIRGAQTLNIPILWAEQIPEKLGPTVPEISNLLADQQPITKASFSCCGEERFIKKLKTLNRKQILIAGIEAHVCVYQTVMDLLASGYEIHVLADAVSSRTLANKEVGLNIMQESGAKIQSVEMVLFELLKRAEGDNFREIIRIVK